jgi:hypothetical protein
MGESILQTIQGRLKGLRGSSGSAPLGFSGADMVPIMDRLKGTSSVIQSKGVMGVLNASMKGERPIMSKMAPGMLAKLKPAAASPRDMPLLKRLPGYSQMGPKYNESAIPEQIRKGGTQIGSIGN